MKRATGGAFPEQRGLPLVGKAERGEVGTGEIGLGDGGEGGAAGGFPKIGGVVLDPAGFSKVLGEFLLGLGDDAAAVIEDEGARRGGALVEGEDEFLVHGAGVGTGWGVEAGPKVTPAAIKN